MLCQMRKCYPVGFGAGLLEQTCADIREGKTHCVLWAAGGLGWEKAQRAKDALLTHQALLEAYLEAGRKAAADLEGFPRAPVVVVVMQHGARRAAAALHAQGVKTVLWVGESLFEEERAAEVLFGLIMPIISKLQQPSWEGRSSDELSHMVVEMGRLVLGGGSTGWNKGGCFVPHTGLPPLQKWSPSPRKQPWVHNLAPHLLSGSRMANFSRAAARAAAHAVRPRQRACKQKSAGLHESLKLVAKIDGTVFDLLDKCDADSLLSWLGAALPRGTRPSRIPRLGDGQQHRSWWRLSTQTRRTAVRQGVATLPAGAPQHRRRRLPARAARRGAQVRL